MTSFNTVDIIIAGLLAVGLLRGVLRGLAGELASLVGIAAAAATGWFFYRPVGDYIERATRMTGLQADAASFLVILIGALILMGALSMLLRRFMAFTFKGPLGRIGGGIVGLARYAAVLAVLIVAVHLFAGETVRQHLIEESLIGRQTRDRCLPWYEELVQRYPDLPLPSAEEEPDDGAPDGWYPAAPVDLAPDDPD